jgi:hypothetical protein
VGNLKANVKLFISWCDPLHISDSHGDDLFMTYKRVRSSWNGEDMVFARKLADALSDRLVRVISLPSPDDEVYESNVLVVLKEIKYEDFEIVSRIASEVGDKVNPLLAGEDERDVLDLFIFHGGKDVRQVI